jgi:hypothetical protein
LFKGRRSDPSGHKSNISSDRRTGTYQASCKLCGRVFCQQQPIYKHLREQHPHVLPGHPRQDRALAKEGFQIKQPGAAPSTTDATIGKENDEEDDREIADISGNPHAGQDSLAFVQWLCSGPISINSNVKPQWRRVLQLCGVDLPDTDTSVVREIYNQSDRSKK